MNRHVVLLSLISLFSHHVSAQSKPNDAISRQIKALNCGKTVTLSYDQGSNVSKLMAVTDNFNGAGRVGVQAMNFAVGFMYSGRELTKAPDKILLTFWVLTKKPRFAENHNLLVTGGSGSLDLGRARDAAKPRENMEYLNFEISREDLSKIAAGPSTQIQLGEAGLTFTRSQLKAISDLLVLSDPTR